MLLFLVGIAILILGYFTYGKFIEKQVMPDDRLTPAVKNPDGVDYVVLPQWKNMLIQLLNIAGVGPVIGVILGIKFGSIVFLIIPIGNLIAGATHDFLGGMMSLRDNGANLPKLIKTHLGSVYSRIFSWFMVFLLLLVVAVFINIPAGLCDGVFCPETKQFWWFVGIIFLYYILATLFPVDKIIGKVYPFFGMMLLLGTIGIFIALLIAGFKNPVLLTETADFRNYMFTAEHAPVIPLLFVTIACGIISGFHATQSPIVARTMKSEKQARATFYGMMVLEGIIGMIWAGAGMAIYNLFPKMMVGSPNAALLKITTYFLGEWMGLITVVAVIILAVTSGDTALRSTRLCLAEMLSIQQTAIRSRILLCLPLIVIVSVLLWWSNVSTKSFGFLWNYFAWGNQVLAASTLMAAAVWLFKQKKNGFVALIPGMFMTFIVCTYILWTSPVHKQAYGFGLPVDIARLIGIGVACLFGFFVWRRVKKTDTI
ncbi:MAG: carbon starvation protein A [Lentisphaeria bacterium]|nr:carbon starvation protein A [Lentisphaeria bacterium]